MSYLRDEIYKDKRFNVHAAKFDPMSGCWLFYQILGGDVSREVADWHMDNWEDVHLYLGEGDSKYTQNKEWNIYQNNYVMVSRHTFIVEWNVL